jgi:lipopolysaccharide biosynthesis glycosyltransferase/tetratricopeptide (TPR) repeat protein
MQHERGRLPRHGVGSLVQGLKDWIKTNPALYARAVTIVSAGRKFDTKVRNRVLSVLDAPLVRGIPGVSAFRLRVALALNKRNELYELADVSPLRDQADLILAHALFKGHQFHNAVEFFEAAEARSPLAESDEFLLAQALRFSGDIDRSLARLQSIRARSKTPNAENIRVSAAILELMRGAYDKAYAVLSSGSAQTPALKWARDYVGYALGRPWGADTLLEPVLSSRPKASASPEAVNLALVDYKSPDFMNMSSNIGDYVQSIAMARHIARHAGPNWTAGNTGISDALAALRRSWPDGEQRTSDVACNIVVVDRDSPWSTTLRDPEARIWLPIFGWFAHTPFVSVPVLPYPDQVRPIFVSFHLNKPDDLVAPLIDYLKRYQPIGCRDRSTRDWLMNQGVEAFLSGCVTTTLALDDAGRLPGGEDFNVEPAPGSKLPNGIKMHHLQREVKQHTFERNLADALALLRRYQGARRIATSRLHCYLPARALGTDVQFKALNPVDRRYDGLVGLSDAEFLGMRDRLTGLLDDILGTVLSGRGEDAVYAHWREITKPLVAESIREREGYRPLFARVGDSGGVAASQDESGTIPIALAFDKNIAAHVPTLLRSIEAHRSRPARYIFMVRDIPSELVAPIEAACGGSQTKWFEMNHFLKGEKLTLIPHTTISTMDRLYLPEILPDVDKVVYLDIDLIVQGDIAELYDVDIASSGIAGRSSINPFWKTQLNVVESNIARLTAATATELRRAASVSTDLLARCFNAGVLVVSLERMRRHNLTEQSTRLAVDFQMNDQEILNYYSAGHFSDLGRDWNAFPYQERIDPEKVKIIHWAGGAKPWSKTRNARFGDRWRRFAVE